MKFINQQSKRIQNKRPQKPTKKTISNRTQPKRVTSTVASKARKVASKVANTSPNAVKNHPITKMVRGYLDPFGCERGTLNGYIDPRPSQKFSSRCVVSYGIPDGNDFILMLAPNVAQDANFPSMALSYGTLANMSLATSTFTSSSVSLTPTGVTQVLGVTATPYPNSVLTVGQLSWRLVSTAVRVKYTGPVLYRGGLLKHFHDSRGEILEFGNVGSQTFTQFATLLDSHNSIIRHNLTDDGELIMVMPSITDISAAWRTGLSLAPASPEFNGVRFGGTTSPNYLSQPTGYIYGKNTTGQTLYFDAELVEHWEIIGRSVDSLSSPSCGAIEVGNALSSVVLSAHHHLAHNPSKPFKSAIRAVWKDPTVHQAFLGASKSLVSAAIAML